MTSRPKAGDNELKFEQLFDAKSMGVKLLGKQRFVSGEVEISVDQSFEHDGKEYLVEIDSGNMAKLLVGQYVLLNQLCESEKVAFFLVIHTYKNYNPMRTVHNLNLVNQGLFDGKGIPFGAVHIDSLSTWSSGVASLLNLLHVPNPPLNPDAPPSGGAPVS
ncbi:MAG: hypothetical protein IE913_10775 [Halothiobacillus sp.]|nr:hypothetical protein [Halothiobacillus sp.]